MTVVAEAAGALDCVTKAGAFKPDVVVVDLSFPHANGVATLQEIAGASPESRIIVLSDKDNEVFVEQALMNGASAYLLKQTATTDLCWAIEAVKKGREFFSPLLIQHLRSPGARVPEPDQREGLVPAGLSPMESRLITMIHQGVIIRQLAQELSANIKAIRQNRPEITTRQSRPRRNLWSFGFGGLKQLFRPMRMRTIPAVGG